MRSRDDVAARFESVSAFSIKLDQKPENVCLSRSQNAVIMTLPGLRKENTQISVTKLLLRMFWNFCLNIFFMICNGILRDTLKNKLFS